MTDNEIRGALIDSIGNDDFMDALAEVVFKDNEFARIIHDRIHGDAPVDLRSHPVVVTAAANGFVVDGCREGMANQVREVNVYQGEEWCEDPDRSAEATVAAMNDIADKLHVEHEVMARVIIATREAYHRELAEDVAMWANHVGVDLPDGLIEFIKGGE